MPPSSANERLDPEQFRPYLALLARTHLGPCPRAKVDASDIVQQTLLDAYRQLHCFHGSSEAEMAGWLRRMLSCNITDAFRAQACQKRDASLERSLEASFDDTCSKLELWIEAIDTSPSAMACRKEQLVSLALGLNQLPEAQRQAIELHHLQGLTLLETAERLDRSLGSVVGLCRRGLSNLREMLGESQSRGD